MTEQVQEAPEVRERKFPVIEIFGPTLQGEGSVIGMQTMFIRFGGCDYRCKMCDSLHAVLPSEIKKNAVWMTAEQIYEQVTSIAGNCRMVTFSGGNPAMWDLTALVDLFHNHAETWSIAVETQGTLWQDWITACDYITVSPKGPGMGEKFNELQYTRFMYRLSSYKFKVATKVVIFDQRDIEFVKQLETIFAFGNSLYLSLGNPYTPQPQRADDDVNVASTDPIELLQHMASLWEDIKQEPILTKAKFLPQLHVLLWNNKQGV